MTYSKAKCLFLLSSIFYLVTKFQPHVYLFSGLFAGPQAAPKERTKNIVPPHLCGILGHHVWSIAGAAWQRDVQVGPHVKTPARPYIEHPVADVPCVGAVVDAAVVACKTAQAR